MGAIPRSATETALTEGGDGRLALDANGVNAYGCAPRPDPGLVALGSSTASVVSESAFRAASALHRRLSADPDRYRSELERVRGRIAELTGASERVGTEIVLAASGTDIHLIARQLASCGLAAPVRAVMADPAETGSGVPEALAGRHFAAQTCLGRPVRKGAPALMPDAGRPAAVALRGPDGRPRAAAEVDAEFVARATDIVASGERCLLVVTDVSKTGLLAPSAACAEHLRRTHPGSVEVLVDACQFRLSRRSILAYLDRGFSVAVTGSKFVTGPAFCGALLLPAPVARRAQVASLRALRDYSTRANWPLNWPEAAALPDRPNVGLLLRWEAALTELEAFAWISNDFTERFLRDWGRAVAARIEDDPAFEAVPVRPIDRGLYTGGWDSLQSVFPFLVCERTSAGARAPISLDRTRRLHRQIQGPRPSLAADAGRAGRRFQLGQPVALGLRDGTPVAALRVCASARGIAAAARDPNGVAAAIRDAMDAFDRLAMLVRLSDHRQPWPDRPREPEDPGGAPERLQLRM